MKRSLIVTADDIGLHRGMIAGAIEAHRNGIVTACSVVANGRDLAHSVELLRDTPTLDPGIHLTLVEERPLLQPQRVRSLVTHRGRFHGSYKAFALRYYAGAIRFDEVERELRAQIELLISRGLKLSHANGHQHLHVLPKLWELTARLADEYRIGYVRVPDDAIPGDTAIARTASVQALNYFGRKVRAVRAKGARLNDRTIGIAEAGQLAVGKLKALLDDVTGLTELVVHPALGAADLSREYAWGYSWEQETAALCDASVREAIRARGIELTSPGALASS